MSEKLLNWVADTFASSDIIDLYFVVSDLVDINLSDAEKCENAFYDSMATKRADFHESSATGKTGSIPNGKRVY